MSDWIPAAPLTSADLSLHIALGLGPELEQHWALRDGRIFRRAREGEAAVAILPTKTKEDPEGMLLTCVVVEDLDAATYQRLYGAEPLRPPARTLGLGAAADQHYQAGDGRLFRVCRPDERPHAFWDSTVPLIAVRLRAIGPDEYQALAAALPPRPSAIPKYHWASPRGAGGHERTDGGIDAT